MIISLLGINEMSEEELDREAVEIFEEKSEEVSAMVNDLQDWLNGRPHLANVRRDEHFLNMFIRGCGGDFERIKDKLDLYYTCRTMLPAWFDAWDPSLPSIQRVLKAGAYMPLRGFDKKGRFVILVRHGQVDPSTMTTDDCYKTLLMILHMAMEGNRQAFTRGYVVIADHEGVTASHALMMTPGVMKKHIMVFQDSYPMENKIQIESSALYLVNMPSVLESILKMFLSYLDDKFQDMINLVKTNKSTSSPHSQLLEDIGAEVLPEEYGGTNGRLSEHQQFWLEETERQEDWLKEQFAGLRVEEHLRPGKPKTTSDVFGSSCSIM